MKTSKGFTLIELLVVIAIIGILASVILASLNSARAKARDAQRVSDITELQKALELYYDDHGSYPATNTWWGACSNFGSHGTAGGDQAYIPNLAPTYIPSLPTDPDGNTSPNCIIYTSNGADYFLMAYTTYEGTAPASHMRAAEPNNVHNYGVWTPGAANW